MAQYYQQRTPPERSPYGGRSSASSSGKGGERPLTVSQAAEILRRGLDAIRLTVVGEVSQLTDRPSYSAVYFTIKDESAVIECKMWRNRYRDSGTRLALGQMVELAGRFDYYALKGSMTFDVSSLRLAGRGDLREQVAACARKLRDEGLMDEARKRRIPTMPVSIGLVTSPNGAAVHDVLRTLRRRYPLARVAFAGVTVEGRSAAAEIRRGLEAVISAKPDVILLVRGGGSFEDLMPFNDEGLARFIAASPIPVVTGIGHEPDNSIADMVADLRCSTPTAAAEAVAPDLADIRTALSEREARQAKALLRLVAEGRERVERLAERAVFSDPQRLTSGFAQGIDLSAERLHRAVPLALERRSERLDDLGRRLAVALPAVTERNRSRADDLARRLSVALPASTERSRARANDLARRLASALPPAIERREAALGEAGRRLHRAIPDGVARHRERIDDLGRRLRRGLPTATSRPAERLEEARRRLGVLLPAATERSRSRADDAAARLRALGPSLASEPVSEMRVAAARLHDLSPVAVIARGYSMARDAEGALLRSVEGASPGDALTVYLSDGSLACTVDAVEAKPKTESALGEEPSSCAE